MTDYYLDKEIAVGEFNEKASLIVRRWPEVDGFLELTKKGDVDDVYWHPISISLHPQMARLLAKALIEMADEVEGD